MDILGDNAIYALLPLVILLAALVFGIVSRMGVGRAKKNDEHTSMRENPRMHANTRSVEGRIERR